jgi:hypothetical protein
MRLRRVFVEWGIETSCARRSPRRPLGVALALIAGSIKQDKQNG